MSSFDQARSNAPLNILSAALALAGGLIIAAASSDRALAQRAGVAMTSVSSPQSFQRTNSGLTGASDSLSARGIIIVGGKTDSVSARGIIIVGGKTGSHR